MRPRKGDLYQYCAPETVMLTQKDFENNHETAVHWLGAAGVMINTHGYIILVDPVLTLISDDPPRSENQGYELMAYPPILAEQIKRVDAICYTHMDEDHMGQLTLKSLIKTDAVFCGTHITCEEMERIGVPKERCIEHVFGDKFSLGKVEVYITPADHPWRFEFEDCCGFQFTTSDGVIWVPGDSMLLGAHLKMKHVDVAFIDFGDNEHHFGTNNAVRLFNTLEKTDMIMYHHATFYAPDKPEYNGDPNTVVGRLNDISRLKLLGPGEKYVLKRKEKRK